MRNGIDYDEVFRLCEIDLRAWRDAQPDKRLPFGEESGFEYGFQMGFEAAWRLNAETP